MIEYKKYEEIPSEVLENYFGSDYKSISLTEKNSNIIRIYPVR